MGQFGHLARQKDANATFVTATKTYENALKTSQMKNPQPLEFAFFEKKSTPMHTLVAFCR